MCRMKGKGRERKGKEDYYNFSSVSIPSRDRLTLRVSAVIEQSKVRVFAISLVSALITEQFS